MISVVASVVLLSGCAATPAAQTSPPSRTAATPAAAAPTPTIVPTPIPPTTAPPAQASRIAASAGPGMLASITEAATTPPAGSIQVVMSGPPPVFRPAALTANAGDVVFYLQNDSPAADSHGIHTLAIGHDRTAPIAVSDEVPGGRRAVFTVLGLEAGDYVIWCTFPGHAGLGQVGSLTVDQ